MTRAAALDAIRALPAPDLKSIFTTDPDRLSTLVRSEAGIRFDWSKTHLTTGGLGAFAALADAAQFDVARDALFSGEKINVTENRAAEHTAERGEGREQSVARARAHHERMRALIRVIENGDCGPIHHILHIGIGGSALGPDLLVDALGNATARYDVEIVSNVDGHALARAFARFDAKTTLIVIASKTFTTTETMLNAASAIAWMRNEGIENPYARVIALTAAPAKAMQWGVDETRILPFSETVGGRYSLWSSVGFTAALALGWEIFSGLLDGAAQMDRHFRTANMRENIPLLAAFADIYYTRVLECETRAVFAYDERLRLLPSYLQQLEMESNGKRVMTDGTLCDAPTAPITWGGVGTDAQHAVFQLLHQGTHIVPIEFIVAKRPAHTLDPAHHRALLTNCFAQGAALLAGRDNADDPARAYPGNRPSVTLLLDDVNAQTLGALIAFYEHRTFANAVLMGINPFDQFGVELGKDMAKAADTHGGVQDFDPSTRALIDLALRD